MEEKRPNVPEWNKMRRFFGDELFNKIENYDVSEKKKIPKYATAKALKKMVKKIPIEDVNQQSIAIGALLDWINETLEAREKAVVVRRIEEKIKAAEEEQARKEAEEAAAEAAREAEEARREAEEAEAEARREAEEAEAEEKKDVENDEE